MVYFFWQKVQQPRDLKKLFLSRCCCCCCNTAVNLGLRRCSNMHSMLLLETQKSTTSSGEMFSVKIVKIMYLIRKSKDSFNNIEWRNTMIFSQYNFLWPKHNFCINKQYRYRTVYKKICGNFTRARIYWIQESKKILCLRTPFESGFNTRVYGMSRTLGAIHKPRGQNFVYFWPSSPFLVIFTYVMKWSFG